MIDIHTHIIPNVDDGSPSFEESLKLIRDSVASGVNQIIATPHHIHHRYEASAEMIKNGFDKLVKKVEEAGIDAKLYLGQEIYYSHENLIDMLKNNKLYTLNGSKYILLEFSFTHEPNDISEVIYDFVCNGYKVIVAHVERYKWCKIDTINTMRQEGALIQINSDSLLGKNGFGRKLFVNKLIKKGLVDFIASDMHSFRPSSLAKAMSKIKNPEQYNKVERLGIK